MQVYCSYSGILLATIDDGFPNAIMTHHPIFDMSLKDLYRFIQHTQAKSPKVAIVQQRLFFLALLNATTLVDWENPYYPSEEAITATYPNLIGLLSILPVNLPTHWRLPRLRISADNNEDIDIAEVVSMWRKSINSYYELDRKASKPVPQDREIADIGLALTERWRQTANSQGPKPEWISWAIESIMEYYGNQYQESVYTSWQDLLTTPVSKVKIAQLDQLVSLRDILADLLPVDDANRQRSYIVQKHLQNLLDALMKFKADMLGHRVERVRTLIADVAEYKIITIDPKQGLAAITASASAVAAQDGKQVNSETTPMARPDRKDYETTSAYITALMAYNKAYYGQKGSKE